MADINNIQTQQPATPSSSVLLHSADTIISPRPPSPTSSHNSPPFSTAVFPQQNNLSFSTASSQPSSPPQETVSQQLSSDRVAVLSSSHVSSGSLSRLQPQRNLTADTINTTTPGLSTSSASFGSSSVSPSAITSSPFSSSFRYNLTAPVPPPTTTPSRTADLHPQPSDSSSSIFPHGNSAAAAAQWCWTTEDAHSAHHYSTSAGLQTPGAGLSLYPLTSSPASCCSAVRSAHSPASAFLSSLRIQPPTTSQPPATPATANIRLHHRMTTPKSNSSLLFAAAALAAAAAAVEESNNASSSHLGGSSSSTGVVGDVSGPRLRRRRGGVNSTTTPTRTNKRRHTVHSDATTSAETEGEGGGLSMNLKEKVVVDHEELLRKLSGSGGGFFASPDSRIEEEEEEEHEPDSSTHNSSRGGSNNNSSPVSGSSATTSRKGSFSKTIGRQTVLHSGTESHTTSPCPPPFGARVSELVIEGGGPGASVSSAGSYSRRRLVALPENVEDDHGNNNANNNEQSGLLATSKERNTSSSSSSLGSPGPSKKRQVEDNIVDPCVRTANRQSALLHDIHNHSKLLYLYSAFHLLILVFHSDFYPKLNGSDGGDIPAERGVPRYGADEWSYYRHRHTPLIAFVKASVLWSVCYAVAIRCVFWLCARHRGGKLSGSLHRLYGMWCVTCLVVDISVFVFGGMMSKCVFFPDLWIGSIVENIWYDPSLFSSFTLLDISLFGIAFLVDVVGLLILVQGAYRHIQGVWDALAPVVGIAIMMAIGGYFMAGNPSCNSGDHHWVDFASHHPHDVDVRMGESPSYHPLRFPAYVKMNDGVRIAVDVYLPKEYINGFRLGEGENQNGGVGVVVPPPLPTYLDITRYDRRMVALWPFTMLSIWKEPRDSSANVWSWQFAQALIPNGYAVVVADTRGTGASEGHREVDFSSEELVDFRELVDWVKRQWWSNGELGMGGISYDGMTGLQAASLGGVKAAVTLFTPMDVIGDLLAPGGMVCSSFVRDYVGLTAKFEEEGSPLKHHLNYPWHYPLHVIMGFLTAFGGALPVSQREDVAVRALREHEKNWDMGKVVQQVEYLDDNITLMDGRILPVASFGITESVMEGLAANNVSVYIAGGYCDSAIVRGSTRLFDYMTKHAPQSRPKMVIGPWTHSGRRSCSPYIGNYPCFEDAMYLDVVRHLDCHLKGKCWGKVLEEDPVRYWQVGEEVWKTSESYPPPSLRYEELHFSNQPLGADLVPLEAEVPEGIVLLNNTVIGELHGSDGREPETDTAGSCGIDEEEDELEEETKTGSGSYYTKRKVSHKHKSSKNRRGALLEHILHDITQLTYIRLKRPGAHHLHHYHRRTLYHRNPKCKAPVTTLPQQHHEFLAKDAYVLRPKSSVGSATAAAGSGGRQRRYYGNGAARTGRWTANGRNGSGGGVSGVVGRGSSSTIHDVVSFKVDYQATTGIFSRWLIAQHPFRMAISYGNFLFPARGTHPMRQRQLDSRMTEESRRGGRRGTSSTNSESSTFSARLSFTTAALTQEVGTVGSPWVKFSAYVSGCTEVSLFVYLEDVDLANGYSHYVTEGKVVASHRTTPAAKDVPIGSPDVVYRSYTRKDYLPVQGSELVEMSLTLEPVSWTFQKGHAIRISMGGADVDNFELRDHAGILPVLPDKWQIIVNDPVHFPAWVRLPVLPDQPAIDA
eukprot:GHVS01099427.1.p1 GENE.GHVS01099427.1~~GHVS01099427.1.p1  ORF type:complete len:1674 (-),score=300.25 GHVS01099427.1:984-6005(-)